ncbi:hypothetical protein HDU93_000678, partial [Gonapodya sp. JEL0774]
MAIALPAATPEPAVPSTYESSAAVKKLWDLYARAWDLTAVEEPVGATMMGDYRFNDKIADLSDEMYHFIDTEQERLLAEVDSISSAELPIEERDNQLFLHDMLVLQHKITDLFRSTPLNQR